MLSRGLRRLLKAFQRTRGLVQGSTTALSLSCLLLLSLILSRCRPTRVGRPGPPQAHPGPPGGAGSRTRSRRVYLEEEWCNDKSLWGFCSHDDLNKTPRGFYHWTIIHRDRPGSSFPKNVKIEHKIPKQFFDFSSEK